MGKKGKYNKQQQAQQDQPKKKKVMITLQHLMDKSHMDDTYFLPYLPQDSLYPQYDILGKDSMYVLRNIVKDLNYLLYLDFKNFWATLLYNLNLKPCISSCLQFLHRNWLNQYKSGENQQKKQMKEQKQQQIQTAYDKIKFRQDFQLTQALFKIILFIYFRIVHAKQQNPQLTELYKLDQQTIKKNILDIPRILELIQIYGENNQTIVKVIMKYYTKLETDFYSQFTEEIMTILLEKLNRNLGALKKISQREEFGIVYSYQRKIKNQLSPGQEQLKKKVCLLMEIISFYNTIKNIQKYFPDQCADYTRFNEDIHNLSQNIFIEIQQAYKAWNMHQNGQKIYPLMNNILKDVKQYFIDFLNMCDGLLVKHTIKSGTLGAYLKCFDRMIQNYGRRASLGKKLSASKRYMDLYREILKDFPLDQLLTKIYMDEIDNGTHGINIEYLVDFKFAIDEIVAKNKGRQQNMMQAEVLGPDQEQTEIDGEQQIPHAERKESYLSHGSKLGEDDDADRKLQILVSKRDRDQNYYEKLYRQYRTKITIDYEDQYDDLKDFEKRPMFEDDANERQGSSDGSSDFDSDEQQLHLVKSISNAGRARAHLNDRNKESEDPLDQAMKNRGRNKRNYRNSNKNNDRANKVKYVPVKDRQTQNILDKYGSGSKKQTDNNQKNTKQKKNYTQKVQKKQKSTYIRKQQNKNKEYDDQQCYQDCKVKIKKEQRYQNDNQDQQNNKNNKRNNNNGANWQKKGGNKNKNKNYREDNNNKGDGFKKTKWVQKQQ